MRTEAELLAAMAKADLQEQRELAKELNALRAREAGRVQAQRETDIASAVIRDTLTPVRVHERHTAATDWIDEVPLGGGDYSQSMRTEATLWFRKTSAEVRADREEFAIQAQGMAQRLASQYGTDAQRAERTFLDEISRLYRNAKGDSPGQVDVDQSGNAESTVTDYDTNADQDPYLSEDWEDDGVTSHHPPMPGAGEGDNTIEMKGRRQAAGEPIVGQPQQYVVVDTSTGIVQSEPMSFDEAETEMMAIGETYFPDEFGSINLGITEYTGMGMGEEIGESSYKHPESWQYRGVRTAAEGKTCQVCGDSIEKDPSSEEPQTWHHNNGESHDHEAKPAKKESARRFAGQQGTGRPSPKAEGRRGDSRVAQTPKTATTKRTDELKPGDKVQVGPGIIRTVHQVVPQGYETMSGEEGVYVYYREGQTPEWSGANSSTMSGTWLLASATRAESSKTAAEEGRNLKGPGHYIDRPTARHNWSLRGPFGSREEAQEYLNEWFGDKSYVNELEIQHMGGDIHQDHQSSKLDLFRQRVRAGMTKGAS